MNRQKPIKTKPTNNPKLKMEIYMKIIDQKRQMLLRRSLPPRRRGPYTMSLLCFFVIAAAFLLAAPDVMAVGDAPDRGLTTGVANLLAILNNKLTPIILVAGCLASLVYSLSIAQPKPFILGLVTLCFFGFARAWIDGTYALIA